MSTLDTRARMISEREQDIAELQAELNVLRSMEAPKANGGTVRGSRGRYKPATRQQMLARIVRDAGHAGLTRTEAIERMAAICDSSHKSVAQMLSILARKGTVKPNPDGHWRATRL